MRMTHDMILEGLRNRQKPFHPWRRWVVSFAVACLVNAMLLIVIAIIWQAIGG